MTLIIGKSKADKIKEGMVVKEGIVITKTDKKIVVLNDKGCLDYKIVQDKK